MFEAQEGHIRISSRLDVHGYPWFTCERFACIGDLFTISGEKEIQVVALSTGVARLRLDRAAKSFTGRRVEGDDIDAGMIHKRYLEPRAR